MGAIPRYRVTAAPTLFSAGFRPFFLLSAAWAAIAVPLWLAVFSGDGALPTVLPGPIWHVHEMVFGYGAATVAGFLLTAIPNWTGRMPLQGAPLIALVLLWIAGRVGVLCSAAIGAGAATFLDLAFPSVFLMVVAREIAAGRNWRNLPMLAALTLLLGGNLLVHAETLGFGPTAAIGNRVGIATLLMLISLVGGRIVPSFTRNWLARERPEAAMPAGFDMVDRIALASTGVALIAWVAIPTATAVHALQFAAGLAILFRLWRWRGGRTLREPLLVILHLGYLWLALGLLLLALNGFLAFVPETAPLHALTVGAVGTMTLAVMTRATLGHTGRPLAAGPATRTIYVLVTLAAVVRLLAPFVGGLYLELLSVATVAWSGAFILFILFYFIPLTQPRVAGGEARAI